MSTLALPFFSWSSLFLQVTSTAIKAWMGLKFCKIWPGSMELAAHEHLKKSPSTYSGRNVVSTLVLSFLNGSSSFLQVTRTTIKAWMSLNFCQIPSSTTLERRCNTPPGGHSLPVMVTTTSYSDHLPMAHRCFFRDAETFPRCWNISINYSIMNYDVNYLYFHIDKSSDD